MAKKKKKVLKKKTKSVTKKKSSVKKKKAKRSGKTVDRTSENASVRITPHFDTAERSQEPDTDVEVPASDLTDSLQTDSRPK